MAGNSKLAADRSNRIIGMGSICLFSVR